MRVLVLVLFFGGVRAEAGPNDVYAIGFSTRNIYQVNTATGATTTVYTNYPIAPATQNSAALAQRRSDGMLFYIAGTGSDGAVYRWNPATPATAPVLLGTTGTTIPYMPRLTFGANGVLYAVNNAGTQLYTISTTTGAATPIGATLSGTPTGGGDMALNPADGQLYLIGGTVVYRVSVAGGALQTVGTITGMSGTVVGAAFSMTGTFLVANNANPARLYTVNLATMAATAFGSAMSTGMGDLSSSPQADISLTKTNGATTTVAGTSTVYTIVASNSGPSGTIRVPVIDTAPIGLTFGSWSCVAAGGGACAAATGAGNLNTFADLPGAASATYTVNATLAASASGSISNTVTAGDLSGAADLTPANNTAVDTDTVLRQANLSITKTDGVTSINALGATSYTVVLSNAGPSTGDGAIVTDPVATGLSKTTLSCAAAGGAVCPATLTVAALEGSGLVVPTLPVGGSVTLTVGATVTATAGSVVNAVTAATASGTTDPTPANNTASDTDTVTPIADLSMSKSDGVTSVNASGTTTYTIALSNGGPSAADGTTVTDPATAGLTKTAVGCVAAGGAVCPATLTIAALEGGGLSVPTLPTGGSITLSVSATVTATSGSVVNTATATVPAGTVDPVAGNNAASDTDTVAPVANLGVAKTDGVSSVSAGAAISYTVTVDNAGPSAAGGAIVTDPAATGLTKTSLACVAAGGAVCPATLTVAALEGAGLTIPTLPSGGSITLTVGATVTATGGSVVNSATVTAPGGTTDPVGANNAASDTDTVTPVANLGITKSDGAGSTPAGGSISYSVVVTNAGPSAADGAVLTDPVATGLNKTSVSCAAAGGAVCPATLTVAGLQGAGLTIPTLPNGGSLTFTVVATVTAASGSVINTATVAAPAGTADPAAGNNTASDTNTVSPVADLSISKTDGVVAVNAGGTASYAIVVSNAGPSVAGGAVVTDPPATGLSKTSVGCIAAGGAACPVTLTVGALEGAGLTIPTLPVGGSITLTVAASVTATGGSVANTAAVTPPAGTADPAAGNNTATDTNAVTPVANLGITKSDGNAASNAGATITYTISVSNAGPSAAGGSIVTDPIATGLSKTGVSCVAAGGAACPASSTVGALEGAGLTIPTLPVGGTVTFNVTATVTATSGSVTNEAAVAPPAGTMDPSAADDRASDVNAVTPVADVGITKTDGAGSVNAGGFTTYTIVVANAGPSAAGGTVIADPATSGLTKSTVSCAAAGGAVCPASLTIAGLEGAGLTVSTLPSGGSVTISVGATVTASSGSVANTATVAAPAGTVDPAAGNNSATDTNTVAAVADLAVTKTDGVTTVNAGGATTYSIVVSNAGPSAAGGATVTDPVAAGLSKTSVSCAAAGGATCPASSTIPALEGAGLLIPTLPSGSSLTFTVGATVTATTGSVSNIAAVGAPAGTTDPSAGNNSATDVNSVAPLADLSMAKTDGVAVVSAGGATVYTLTVSNAGPSAADGAVVTDPATAGLTKTSVTCTASGGAACPATVTVAALEASGLVIPTLPSGGGLTFTVNATVTATNGSVANTAVVAAPAGVSDPVVGNNTATDTNTVSPVADLAVSKSDGTASVDAGGTTTFIIVVSNAGPSPAGGTVVVDPVAAGFTVTTLSCVAAGGATCPTSMSVAALQGAGLTISDLPAGGSITLSAGSTITATGGSISNTATVTTPVGVTDPSGANNSATDTNSVQPVANLSITKSNGASGVAAGGTTTYVIVAANAGPSAADGAVIADPAVAGLSKVAVSCVASGGAACPAPLTIAALEGAGLVTGALPSGGTVTLTVTATVTAPSGTVSNVATLTPPAGVNDPANGNNSATDLDPVDPVADVSIVKTDGVAAVNAGDSTSYVITVGNAGPSPADGSIVLDPAVAGLTKTSLSCAAAGGATCPASPSLAALEGAGLVIPLLPAGGTVTFTLGVTVTATAGSVANVATVTAPAGVTDPSAANNSSTDVNTVSPIADLSVTKTDGVAGVPVGGSTTYTVVVSNAGPSPAGGALLLDPVAPGLAKSGVSCIATGGAVCPSTLTVAALEGGGLTIATLPAGGAVTFTIVTSVTASGGSVTNTATVTAPGGVSDPSAANNSATDTDLVDPVADLSLTKSNGVNSVTAGATTTYTIVVSNAGPSPADGAIVVTDPASTGHLKTGVNCSATGGATCPPSPTVAQLEGGGLTVSSLPPAASVTFTVTATVTAVGGTIGNTAGVTPPAGVTDPTPGNNTATDTDAVIPSADLGVTKSNGTGSVSAGGTTSYTIGLSNAGPSPADGAVVSDPAVVGLTKSGVTCVAAGGAVCPVTLTAAALEGAGLVAGALPSGGSLTFTVTASVTATNGSVTNTVTVAPPAGVTDPSAGNNSAADTDAVTPIADLAVTKSNGGSGVTAAGTTTYTVVVENHGPSSADGALVTDAAAAGLSKTSVGCSASGGAVCPASFTVAALEGAGLSIPTLSSGGAISLTITAAVTATSGSVANTVSVAAPAGVTDPSAGNNSASDSDPVSPIADLAITKTNGVSVVNAGSATTYSVVVSNAGPSAADGAVVVDAAAAGLSKTGVSCSVTGGATCPVTLTVAALEGAGLAIPTLPSGATMTLTVAATVTATGGVIANTATVVNASGITDPNGADNSATDTDAVQPIADLAVTKSDGVASVPAGGSTSYSIVVSNAGPSAAAAATVTDPAAVGLTKTSLSCSASGGASCPVTLTIGALEGMGLLIPALPNGGAITLTVGAAVTATGGAVVNTATVVAPAGVIDPSAANNGASDTDLVDALADISVSKTDGAAAVDAGGSTAYAVIVSNAGPSAADGAVLVDPAAAGLTKTGVSCSATGGASCPGATTVAALEGGGLTISTLPAGASVVFTVFATVTATGGTIANVATVTAPAGVGDSNLANNSATDTNTVAPVADLAITKSNGTATTNAGATTTYMVVVSNAGPSPANGAAVTDLAVAGVSKSSVSCVAASGAVCPAASTIADLEGAGLMVPTLPAGGSVAFTIAATVTAAGGSVANTAGVTAPTGVVDPTLANNSATDTDMVGAVADLAVTKSNGAPGVDAGATTTYSITVTNAGPSAGDGAIVADAAAAGLTKTGVSCIPAGGAVCPVTTPVSALEAGLVVPALPSGGSLTLTVVATVTAATGSVANVATVTAPAGVTDPAAANNTATDTDPVNAVANLAVSKTDGVASANASGSVTYAIVVSNAGPSAADGAVLIDPAVPGLSKSAVGCTAAPGAVCPAAVTVAALEGAGLTIPTLPAGSSVTFSVAATVTATGGSVANAATIAPPAGVSDPSSVDNSATDTNTVVPVADLIVTNTDGVTSLTPGGTTTYTVVVTNAGPSAASGAGLAVTAPSGIAFTAWTCVSAGGATCPASGTGNVAEIIDVPAGGTVTFTISATVSGGAVSPIATTATATPPSGVVDPNPADNSATDSDMVGVVADLSVTKTNGGATVVAGSSTSYTIAVGNAGPSGGDGAVLTDAAVAGLSKTAVSCVAASGAVCPTGLTIALLESGMAIATLPTGGSIVLTVTADVTATGGTVTNSAVVAAAAGAIDPATGNNSSSDVDTVVRHADLSVTKSNGATSITSGLSTTYAIVVTNAGPSAADGALLVDAAVAGLTKTSVTCVATSGGAACPSTLTVAGLEGAGLVIPTLPAGGSVGFSVATAVTATAGTVSNVVSLTPPVGVVDPSAANDVATDADAIDIVADLGVTKTNGVGSLNAGATTAYTIVVGNAGPSLGDGALVIDPVTVGLVKTSVTCTSTTGGAICPAGVSVGSLESGLTIATLPAGSSVTFSVAADVTSASESVSNVVTVSAAAGASDLSAANNTAVDSDTITQQANLSVTKTDGVAAVVAGGSTMYTVVVSNAGPSPADGATVIDPAVAGLAKSSVSCVAVGGAVCPAGLTVAMLETGAIIATLPSAGQLTFSIGATASGSAGAVANVVTVSSPGGVTDPDPSNDTATDTNTVTPVADLSVTITDGVVSLTPGGTTTYTVVVGNAGPSAVMGAALSVTAPAGLTFGAWSCAATGGAVCPAAGSGNLAAAVDVPAGGTLTFTVAAAVAAGASGSLSTLATVAPPTGTVDPTPANNSATDVDGVGLVADLSVTKTDGTATVTAAGATTYTVVVSNGGPSAADNATVIDAAVVGLSKTAVSCVAAGGAACPSVTVASLESGVTLPALPSGGALTFTVAATVTATTGSVANTASVTAPGGVTDPAPANNSATDTNTVTPVADLSVTITDGVVSLTPGGTTTYTVVVGNAGPSAVTGAPLSVTAPAGLTFGAWSCAATGGAVCPAAGSGNLAAAVDVPAGGTLTFTVAAAVAAGASGSLSTLATVVPPTGTVDPTPANNSVTDVDGVGLVADLSVTISDGTTSLTPGGGTTYTVVVANSGPSTATAASLAVPAPVGLTFGAWSCAAAGGAVCPASASGNLAATVDVPTGGTLSFTIPAVVSAGASGSVAVTATVTPAAGTVDPVAANNAATDTDTVIVPTPTADLVVTKTDGVNSVDSGGTTTYTIVVTNSGPDAAHGAVVVDAATAGLTKTAVSCAAGAGAACPVGLTVAGLESPGLTIPTLPSGGSVTLTVMATVTAVNGTVVNVVSITPPAGVTDPAPVSNTASDTDGIGLVGELSVTKSNGVTSLTTGGAATYVIVVSNAGPAAANGAVVSDPATAGLTKTGVTCVPAAGATCPAAVTVANLEAGGLVIPTLPAGGSLTLTVTASVTAVSGSVANTVTVTSPAGVTDPVAGNNSQTDTDAIVAVAALADLAVAIDNGTATATAGGVTTYTITVTNAGPSAVANATLTSVAPAGLTFGAWSCQGAGGGNCPPSGSGNLAALVSLPIGASVTFSVSAAVASTATSSIVTTAAIVLPAGVSDPNLANNGATDTDTVTAATVQADLAISKSNNASTLGPGASTVYTIVVSNAGPGAVTGAVVRDSGSSVLALGAWTCVASAGASCPPSGSGNLNSLVTLPAGGTATFSVTAAVASNATGSVSNTATVTAPAGISDPVPANNSATDDDAIPSQRIAVAKRSDEPQYVAPLTFEVPYTIRVVNDGRIPATNVQVTDSLADAFAAGGPAVSVRGAPTATPLNGATPAQCATSGAFNGVSVTSLLAGSATLAPGQGCEISFRVRVAYPDVAAIPTGPQVNQAMAATYAAPGSTRLAADESDSGGEPTTSNAGAPGDTGGADDPTPVTFIVPRLDITKAVARIEQVDDTTFDVRYVLRLKNTAAVPARNVQVGDDLAAAFALGSPALSIVDGPSLGDGDGRLTLATGASAFDGTTRTMLLTGDDVMAAGQSRALAFTVRLRFASASAIPANRPLLNVALATTAATPGAQALTIDSSTDVTTTGADPTPTDDATPTVALLVPRARLSIVKVAATPIAEIGESVTYAIRVINQGGPFLPTTTVEDRLPLGFSYIDGTARLTVAGAAGQRIGEPRRSGSALEFALPAQPTIGEATLTYRVRVGVGAPQGDGLNRAVAVTDGGLRSNESLARVLVRGGVFTDDACVIGRVFVDLNGNRLVDADEPGIPGVRVALEDGTSILTDGSGSYSTCGIRPGTHAIKVDRTTLPAGAQLVVASNRQASDPDTMFLDLKFGELRRADWIARVADPSAVGDLLAQVASRRARSERGLLPPEWSGGISGSLAAVRGAGVGLITPAASGAAAGPPIASQPRLFDNVTGNLPAPIDPLPLAHGRPPIGRIELRVDPASPTSADGAVRVDVALFDADGRLVQGPARVRVELAGGTLATMAPSDAGGEPTTQSAEARVPETGTLIDVVDGRGLIEVHAADRARDVELRATSGAATASGRLSFPTPSRPLMAVGVVEGLIALTSVRGDAMTPARPGDVFDRELTEWARRLGDDGVVGARGAMYLRGTVKGEYLMTLAYDSERQDRGVLFRDIQPDAFYPVYGDASVKTFDAQTSGKFYLRVERGASYLLYGDMLTAAPIGEARNLGTYSRSLTGLQHRLEKGRAVVNLFASRDTLRQVIDEVGGRGISGPYSVSNANGVSGTEKVEIVTRDRNQPALILSAVPLTRFVDYEFEPFSGRVLFRKPVPSMDERLNPVSVRITYEVDGGGERHWVDGADGQFGIGRFVTVGGSFAQDHNPFAPFGLASVNATVAFGASTTLVVEGARTASTLNTGGLNRATSANLATLSGEVDGNALRAELRHESARLRARAYIGSADPAFNNPSASLYGGRAEAGARAAWQLAPALLLRGEALQSRDRLTGGERRGGLLSLESRFRRLTFEAGVRRMHETADPAQASSFGLLQPFSSVTQPGFGFRASGGAIDPMTGLPIVSGGASPLLSAGPAARPFNGREMEATTARARVSLKLSDRVSTYGEAEQDVSDADKRMAAAGGEFRFSDRGRLYGRHEFISSLDGIYALAETPRTQRTVFGLSTGYMKGGDAFSEYRMNDGLSGREAQAAIGLKNAWTLTDGVRLSTGVERLNPLRSTAAAATAASLGLEHTRSRDLKATGRLEWRREGTSHNWLSTLGVARRLSRDWTLLAKNYYQLTQPKGAPDQVQNRLWFGTAYRDQETNRVNLLSRYELRLERLPLGGLDAVRTDRTVHVASTHADYHPAPAWNLFGQYAGKWVREQFDDGAPTRFHAHLAATRATYDLTSRLDVGAMGSVMWSAADSRIRTAVGGEVGVLLRSSMWLSFGYNLTGFDDRDFRTVLRDGYTTRGAYVRLRVKFDEDLFRRK